MAFAYTTAIFVVVPVDDVMAAVLDAAMIGAIQGAEIRFPVGLLEIEGGLFKQFFLIAFDGEVVVCAPILDQISGQFMLGQQGISGDGFSPDVDGIQQRDGGLDFVGLFFLVPVFYW